VQTIVDTHTRVYVVVAVRVYREGIVNALSHQDGVTVVGAADGASLAYDSLAVAESDVVLLGPLNADPLEEIGMVRTALPSARIVMVAVPDSELYVLTCARCGVAGLVTVEASLQDLVAAIRGAERDELICSPRTAAMLLRHVANGLVLHSGEVEPRLTAREWQVAELVSNGLTNKEIAGSLHIELSTVKNHVHSVLAKLEVARRFDILARIRQIRALESVHVRLDVGQRTAM
jgi:two-component system, NarL family, nitrate/nitrite response regulator NarL